MATAVLWRILRRERPNVLRIDAVFAAVQGNFGLNMIRRSSPERAEAVRSVFTVRLRGIDPDPVMPDAAGGGFADAVVVIGALAAAIGRRFSLPTVSLVQTAVAVSGGRLLAPGWSGGRVQHESTLP